MTHGVALGFVHPWCVRVLSHDEPLFGPIHPGDSLPRKTACDLFDPPLSWHTARSLLGCPRIPPSSWLPTTPRASKHALSQKAAISAKGCHCKCGEQQGVCRVQHQQDRQHEAPSRCCALPNSILCMPSCARHLVQVVRRVDDRRWLHAMRYA